MADTENMMSLMRREFMPRETLDITFNHIQGKLEKIEENLKCLPRELANEFEDRFGERILRLEKELDEVKEELEEVKAIKWRLVGVFSAVQVALGGLVALFEMFFKH